MIWLFLTAVLLLAVAHPGFRRFLFWSVGTTVALLAFLMFAIGFKG